MDIVFKQSSKFLVIPLYIEAPAALYKNPNMWFLKATLAMQSTPQTKNNLTKTSPFCISCSQEVHMLHTVKQKHYYRNTVMKAGMQGQSSTDCFMHIMNYVSTPT